MPSTFVAVLVDPARAANVGAAARALKNFGGELRVVRAGALLAAPEAKALAWNAQDVLEAARTYETLDEAIADCSLAAASTSRAPLGGGTLTPRSFAEESAALPPGARAACVFGSEESGLANAELDACRARLRIPTRAEQPSLNLAQAVVIVAYEVSIAAGRPDAIAAGEVAGSDGEPALEQDLARLAAAFEDLAVRAGFLNPQAPEHVLGELRRLVGRARPTRREVTLLQGLVAQLRWSQGRLREGD